MWQTKLGTCIYTSSSGYKIHQNLFYRWLTMNSNALQTVINRRHPEKPVLYYLPALTLMARTFPASTCLLGLGGAGVAHMLSCDTPIVAVDNSEEIMQLAKQFFMTDRLPNLTLIHQNAAHYVEECLTQYPHLIVDLYGANYFPIECMNDAFFIHCKNRLTDNGFIAINLANLKEQWPIFQLIKKQFKHTIVIPIKKSANLVIIACNHENGEFFINRLKESGEIKKITWIIPWGYIGKHS